MPATPKLRVLVQESRMPWDGWLLREKVADNAARDPRSLDIVRAATLRFKTGLEPRLVALNKKLGRQVICKDTWQIVPSSWMMRAGWNTTLTAGPACRRRTLIVWQNWGRSSRMASPPRHRVRRRELRCSRGGTFGNWSRARSLGMGTEQVSVLAGADERGRLSH